MERINHNDQAAAFRWNMLHPKGTRVRVLLVNGGTFEAKTATHAQQWGGLIPPGSLRNFRSEKSDNQDLRHLNKVQVRKPTPTNMPRRDSVQR